MQFLAKCVLEGETWGMPVIAFINPPSENQFNPQALSYACRVGAELGADVIKTNYPGSYEKFRLVVDQALTPVIIEYAPLPETDKETVNIVKNAIQAGGAGVNFGTRLLNSSGKRELTEKIAQIIHLENISC